jgi:hypothetical protein
MNSHDHDVRAILRREHGRADGPVATSGESERLAALWRRLPDPGPIEPPPGFAASVVRRLEADEVPESLTALWRAPSLVRAMAACGLAAGVAVGVGVATLLPQAVPESTVAASAAEEWVVGTTLAESWLSFSEEGS